MDEKPVCPLRKVSGVCLNGEVKLEQCKECVNWALNNWSVDVKVVCLLRRGI